MGFFIGSGIGAGLAIWLVWTAILFPPPRR